MSGGEWGTLVRALMGGCGREHLWLGKLRQPSTKLPWEWLNNMCCCGAGGMGRFGEGNSDYWGEPEVMELRKEALDWGVAGWSGVSWGCFLGSVK